MATGIVILHKEEGMTSHTAVRRLARLFGEDKAGHTGTLDPMATGVLPVLLGRGVKASAYLTEKDKHYIATLRLGLTTDTQDVTGRVLTRCDALPTPEEVLEAAKEFVGDVLQTPPMYSALKVGGKKLVDLARNGVEVDRQARPITVYSLTVTPVSQTDYTLDVHCSKGTYIRTLCADIGDRLGCGGVMASLIRSATAGFSLSAAHTLGELEAMTPEERMGCLIPVEQLFSAFPAVTVGDFFSHLLHNGACPARRKLGIAYPPATKLRLYDKNGFFALGEVVDGEEPTVRVLTLFSL